MQKDTIDGGEEGPEKKVMVQSDLEARWQIDVADLFDRYTDIGF